MILDSSLSERNPWDISYKDLPASGDVRPDEIGKIFCFCYHYPLDNKFAVNLMCVRM